MYVGYHHTKTLERNDDECLKRKTFFENVGFCPTLLLRSTSAAGKTKSTFTKTLILFNLELHYYAMRDELLLEICICSPFIICFVEMTERVVAH